jgi:hypothetical protein
MAAKGQAGRLSQVWARKPSHFGSNDQPRLVGSGPDFASIGSGRRTARG